MIKVYLTEIALNYFKIDRRNLVLKKNKSMVHHLSKEHSLLSNWIANGITDAYTHVLEQYRDWETDRKSVV